MVKQWAVFDMDDGILRLEPTRRAAVRWLTSSGAGQILARHSYGPGDFEYVIGRRAEEAVAAFFVLRSDLLHRSGWDPGQIPLYPVADDPYERIERARHADVFDVPRSRMARKNEGMNEAVRGSRREFAFTERGLNRDE